MITVDSFAWKDVLPRIPHAKRKRSLQDNNKATEEGQSGAVGLMHTDTYLQMGQSEEGEAMILQGVKSGRKEARHICIV